MTQSIKKIEDKIGTPSNPSKMPSYAWGIPIEYCDTGMKLAKICLLYTSPSPRDAHESRMPSSA